MEFKILGPYLKLLETNPPIFHPGFLGSIPFRLGNEEKDKFINHFSSVIGEDHSAGIPSFLQGIPCLRAWYQNDYNSNSQDVAAMNLSQTDSLSLYIMKEYFKTQEGKIDKDNINNYINIANIWKGSILNKVIIPNDIIPG